MKRTYEGTLFVEDLKNANVTINYFNGCKYTEKNLEIEQRVNYTGLTSWDIIEGGVEAEEIENDGLVDEFHEYLVLHFIDGTEATFRNSHVDMFIR